MYSGTSKQPMNTIYIQRLRNHELLPFLSAQAIKFMIKTNKTVAFDNAVERLSKVFFCNIDIG